MSRAQGTAKEAVSTLGTGSDASKQVNRLLGPPGGPQIRIITMAESFQNILREVEAEFVRKIGRTKPSKPPLDIRRSYDHL